jgi:hypothetical protein
MPEWGVNIPGTGGSIWTGIYTYNVETPSHNRLVGLSLSEQVKAVKGFIYIVEAE